MASYDEVAQVLFKKQDALTMSFGRVASVNPMTVTTKGATVSAVDCCGASVGQTVLVVSQGGTFAAIAVRR